MPIWDVGVRGILYMGTNNFRRWNYAPVDIEDGDRHYVAWTITGAAQADINNAIMYADGGVQNINSTVATDPQFTKVTLRIASDDAYFNGNLDEIRLSKVVRSADWIEATYLSGTDVFITYGADLATSVVVTNTAIVAANITANLSGTITDISSPSVIAGFVWDVVSRGNPGDVAPAGSAYASSWTGTGTYGIGEFNHTTAPLLPLTQYYYRAAAWSCTSWAYGQEVSFFVGEDGKIYYGVPADLNQSLIRKNAVPTDWVFGTFTGYSLPVWATPAAKDEQLYFQVDIPEEWDGDSTILIHVHTSTTANEEGNIYELKILHNHSTPNVGEGFPGTVNMTQVRERLVTTDNTSAHYMEVFTLAYDHNPANPMIYDDIMGFIIRHVNDGQADNVTDEIVVLSAVVYFARGDLLGDPVDGITEVVLNILINFFEEGAFMIYLMLALIALGLTITMFATRNLLLGFPSGMFWGILGGYAYTMSEATWDWQYFLFFASFGMAIFSFMAMYALREKDLVGPDDVEKATYIDEEKEPKIDIEVGDLDKPGPKAQAVRDRADKRRKA